MRPFASASPSQCQHRHLRRLLAFVLIALIALSRSALGQVTTVLGSIDGVVTDESSAAIPGVTLSLASPALLVQQQTAISTSDGRYRFADLPVGTYRLQAELQGFQMYIRENLQLSAGFAARVDIVLKVGNVTESVIVTGASPVVDVTTTSGGQTLPTQVINTTLPTLGHEADLVKLTPGTAGGVGTKAANPGETGLQANMSMSAYGQPGVTALVEDFEMHSNNQPPNGTDTEEQQVKTYGNGPEIQYAGAAVNYVFNSGGNQFHGNADAYFMNDTLESNNLTDALRANGLIGNEAIQTYGEAHLNAGGPILRDKLWFFLSGRESNSTRTIGGFVTEPGGTAVVPVAGHRNGNVMKLTHQLSNRHQLTGLWWHDNVKDWGDCSTGVQPGASCRTIPESASAIYYLWDNVWYGEYKGTPSNKLAFDFKAGRSSYHTKYDIKPGFENQPSGYDIATQQFYGSPIATGTTTTAQRYGTTYFWQYTGNMTYVPEGILRGSTFKAGFRSNLSTAGGAVPNHPAGNYMQIWDGGQPSELVTFTFPLNALSNLNIDSVYASDNWQIGKRLTLNLGLRFDYEHSFIPPETQEASTFVAAASYPAIDVGTFKLWSPRAAVAWDVTGRGRTVVKMTLGRYNQMLPYYTTNFADMYNPVVTTVSTYKWTPQGACGLAACPGWTPFLLGQVDTSPGSPALLSRTGPLNTAPLSPTFVVPHVNEYTASIERELAPGVSGRLLYVFKRTVNNYDQVNIGIPSSAYSIQRTVISPLGQTTVAYDYPVSARNFLYARINRRDSQSDYSNNVEVAVNKRLSNHWSLLASWDELKQHVWITGGFQVPAALVENPNLQYYPINETWNFFGRFSSSYELPFQILVAGTLNVVNGVRGQQTGVFRGFNQGVVTLALSPFGNVSGPVQKYFDLRTGKTFRFGHQTLQLSVDIFNALNTNAAQAMSFTEGPTYLQVTQIPNPRIAKLGVQFGF
jgi:hypothetical protein